MIEISLKNIAEISLSALKSNIQSVRNTIGKHVKICAVVKANAYGHGAGLALQMEKFVDCFAVALVEEGVELRLCGVEKPILVLLPTDIYGAERGIRYSLTFTLDSFDSFKALDSACKQTKQSVFVHIKVDTGMHRFGFSVAELEGVCDALKHNPNFVVKGCFSHLRCPQNISITNLQYEEFIKAKNIISKYFKALIYHLSASGGVLLGEKYNFDMVRPGLLLYGYKPFDCDRIAVKPILKIKAKRLYSKEIIAGEGFLYGNFIADESVVVDIVRAGYADGLPRIDDSCFNSRCMDVSGVLSEGDDEYVTVLNDVTGICMHTGRIPYEVLCGITERSHIIYKDDL